MKTLYELYNEVVASEELQNEILSMESLEELVTFAAKHGCDTTLDDIEAFLEEKQKAFGELSEEELEQVAGGGWCNFIVEMVIDHIRRSRETYQDSSKPKKNPEIR